MVVIALFWRDRFLRTLIGPMITNLFTEWAVAFSHAMGVWAQVTLGRVLTFNLSIRKKK